MDSKMNKFDNFLILVNSTSDIFQYKLILENSTSAIFQYKLILAKYHVGAFLIFENIHPGAL